MAKTKSPKFSFKGWDFKEWLYGNKKTIKEFIKVGVPFLVATFATNDPYLTALITGAGKLVLDSLEYYLKSY